MNPDMPQKNLDSAIKLYDDLQQVTKKAGKEAEFLQMSIKLKVTKEMLDSVNDDLKELYNWVVDKTQDNQMQETTPTSSSTDATDVKFTNTHSGNNTRKTARMAAKVDRKTEKIDNIIRNKTGLNGIDGLVAAVDQLSQEVRSQYPELFGSSSYEEGKKKAENIDPTKVKEQYEAEVKKGKSPQSAAESVMKDAYKKSTDWLVKNANFDPGIAQAAVIGTAIWGILKSYPAIRGVFPDGISGFLLMGLGAYAAAKNIPGDKVMDMYEGMFGKIPGRLRGGVEKSVPSSEISYMALESSDFQNGQMFFAGLIKHLKDPKDTKIIDIMKTYYVADNNSTKKSFNIEQFVADYEAGAVGYTGPKKVINPQLRQAMKITPQSDLFMGFVAGRVDSPNGAKTVSKEIDVFLAGIVGDSYGKSDLDTVKTIIDQHATYGEINKKRYHILKNAGYELNTQSGDKRKEIDSVVKTVTGKTIAELPDNYILTDEQIKTIKDELEKVSPGNERLIEAGTTGAAGFKFNDIMNEKSVVLSNMSDKKKTITAMKTGFGSAIDALPEDKKKFIRLVIDNTSGKDVLCYQHDKPGSGLSGVKIPIDLGGDKNVSLYSMSSYDEIATDPQGWKRIFEMAEYEANLIQLYEGQANPNTKEYFTPVLNGIKFNGSALSNRLTTLFAGKNPFGDTHKAPEMLSGGANKNKAIQDYCNYLNGTMLSNVWQSGQLPQLYQSIESGVTGVHESSNVGNNLSLIQKAVEDAKDGNKMRFLNGDLKLEQVGAGVIKIIRKGEGESVGIERSMTIKQVEGNPNRWSLQYYSNGSLVNFPSNPSYEGLESADKCVRLADELLGIQIKYTNRANGQFKDPFFLNTQKTTALGSVKLWKSDGDRGIYFINDRNHNGPYENTNQVKKSFETAECVLSQATLGSISSKFTDFDGPITYMINNMSNSQGKSEWFVGKRPADNPKIVYETIIGKTVTVVDKTVRGAGSLVWGWVEDAGNEAVDTVGNVANKFTNRVKELINYQDQPETLSERLKQLKLDGLSKEQKKEKVLLSIITYKSFAPLYALVQGLVNEKNMDFSKAYVQIFGKENSMLRKQLSREVAIAMTSNATIFSLFGNGVHRESELNKYFSTHVRDIDFGMIQNIKTALGNLKDGALDQWKKVIDNMKKRTGEGTFMGKLLKSAEGTALGLGDAIGGSADFLGGVGSVFGALGNLVSFILGIFK